jgi:hypothetical protein
MSYYLTFLNPKFLNQKGERMPNTGDWQGRHHRALRIAGPASNAIVAMIAGWADYADTHKARYESGIGEDGVLGPAWAAMGGNLRTLLNGELGGLDGGTLDGFLCNTLTAEGFDPADL